ncbi:hypothetical protein BpHYR1_053988 [Brachionus plicatilis]|uniref:Uncharacterized protein n=1 Tax=Brachionus plicatilis TaxID=10195 RepID=A0A3M7PU72_BRAPC|nr:hypothetical protein BpHYR1_053988 [Brachionus plicatilis]
MPLMEERQLHNKPDLYKKFILKQKSSMRYINENQLGNKKMFMTDIKIIWNLLGIVLLQHILKIVVKRKSDWDKIYN